jgi:M6 family metalloprotease-like protein
VGVKIIQMILALLALAVLCFANPASNETFFIKQPDGSSVEVRQIGDEYFHVLETADGYILQKDALGYYAYADAKGESSGIYARDAQDRSESDVEFLAALDPDAIYERLYETSPKDDVVFEYGVPAFAKPKIKRIPAPDYKLTMSKLRGFVLLVQFPDIKFKITDPKKLYTDFMNKEGFNENYNTGSVRDYFIKNSMGKFDPSFDIYGPVTVSGERTSYGNYSLRSKGARLALTEALDSLFKQGGIDLSPYDIDNDGYIDFLFMIYAGVGAADSPVSESIWPHAGSLGELGYPKDGMKLSDDIYANRYACANEINGRAYTNDSNTSIYNGIGTAIHELSHVLGLHDLYDTKQKHKRKTPSYWDVMDNGSYYCPTPALNTRLLGCAPPLYSAFERMSLGWLTPTELNVTGPVKLDKLDDNVAYSVTNPKNPNELFMMEYRTKKEWDRGVPSSGMLIWHIDYVDSIWKSNSINIDSTHMHVDIVEAIPEKGSYGTTEDPFPGTGNVAGFSNFVFWTGDSMKIALSDITESSDKEYVTFNVDMTVKSSSSSEIIESSSSEHPVFAMRPAQSPNVRVQMHKGYIFIYAPQHGFKNVRLFSPIGTLLFETTMDGHELKIENMHQMQGANVILSVTQGRKQLFTGFLSLKNF